MKTNRAKSKEVRLQLISESIKHEVKESAESVEAIDEAADLSIVAAGLAAILGSSVGIAGLMEYLKKKYPKAYATLSDLGSAASASREK